MRIDDRLSIGSYIMPLTTSAAGTKQPSATGHKNLPSEQAVANLLAIHHQKRITEIISLLFFFPKTLDIQFQYIFRELIINYIKITLWNIEHTGKLANQFKRRFMGTLFIVR